MSSTNCEVQIQIVVIQLANFNNYRSSGTQRAKHIDVIRHWCLDRVGRREFEFKYCSTHLNRVDDITTALPRPAFLTSLDMWYMDSFNSP